MESIFIFLAAVLNSIFHVFWCQFVSDSWRNWWKVPLRPDVKNQKTSAFLLAFIGSLWTSYGLFLMIKHIQPKSIIELVSIAFGTWLLILVGMNAKHYSFYGRGMKELLIDYSQDLLSFIIMSFILWGV